MDASLRAKAEQLASEFAGEAKTVAFAKMKVPPAYPEVERARDDVPGFFGRTTGRFGQLGTRCEHRTHNFERSTEIRG